MTLATGGYVERAILDALADSTMLRDHPSPGPMTGPELVDAVTDVRALGERDGADENPESRAASTRRACARLAEKGLIIDLETARETDTYVGSLVSNGGYQPERPATTWFLTPEGIDELRRLDERYMNELQALMRRYGRSHPMDEWTAAATAYLQSMH